jgi:hypothetical protein
MKIEVVKAVAKVWTLGEIKVGCEFNISYNDLWTYRKTKEVREGQRVLYREDGELLWCYPDHRQVYPVAEPAAEVKLCRLDAVGDRTFHYKATNEVYARGRTEDGANVWPVMNLDTHGTSFVHGSTTVHPVDAKLVVTVPAKDGGGS